MGRQAPGRQTQRRQTQRRQTQRNRRRIAAVLLGAATVIGAAAGRTPPAQAQTAAQAQTPYQAQTASQAQTAASVTVDATAGIGTVPAHAIGLNTAVYDGDMTDTAIPPLLKAAGTGRPEGWPVPPLRTESAHDGG